jgi:hypothetical protein
MMLYSYKNIQLILFIFLIPLSKLFVVYQNLTLLDIIIVLYFLYYGIIKLKKFRLSNMYLIQLLAIGTSLIFYMYIGTSEQGTLAYLQLIYLFFVVQIFIYFFFSSYSIFSVLNVVLILGYLLSVLIIIEPIYDTRFVRFDQVARYFTLTSGTTAIFTLSFSYLSYLYINSRITLISYLPSVFLIFGAAIVLGQKSLFLSLLLIFLSISFKRPAPLLLLFFIFFFFFFMGIDESFFSNSRVVFKLLEGSERIKIIEDLFYSFSQTPSAIVTGFGAGEWVSVEYMQRPHNYMLHLIADFGLLTALVSTFSFFSFFLFFNLSEECETKKLYMLIVIGLIPYYMTHTYTLERGQIILFMVISFYFYRDLYRNRIFQKKYTKSRRNSSI